MFHYRRHGNRPARFNRPYWRWVRVWTTIEGPPPAWRTGPTIRSNQWCSKSTLIVTSNQLEAPCTPLWQQRQWRGNHSKTAYPITNSIRSRPSRIKNLSIKVGKSRQIHHSQIVVMVAVLEGPKGRYNRPTLSWVWSETHYHKTTMLRPT